jgi:hypothetical protein
MDPVYIPKYQIYDVVYNDASSFVLILPFEYSHPPQIQRIMGTNTQAFTCTICPHGHTLIYTLSPSIYSETITIQIDRDDPFITPVNRYPSFTGELVFSTLLKDEDSIIIQWIEFYRSLGVSRFILYDNSEKFTLDRLLAKYILDEIVIIIHWPYQFLCKKSGFSAQTTQQNHSIRTFTRSRYIGLFDVDEFLNLQAPHKSLLTFLNSQPNLGKISGFSFLNRFFYNPDELSTTGVNFFKCFTCDQITRKGREKCIVCPLNVNIFAVHMVVDGKPIVRIYDKDAYFNHYIFLNKPDRGRDRTNLTDNSILRHLITKS